MDYPGSVRFLYALGNELKAGAKWSLDRIQILLQRLCHPERKGRFVHVAGTNGKGSTSAMIASALSQSGRRTGLFTSPHLIQPTERIQIDGKPVSDTQFASAFDAVHRAAGQLESESAIDAHPSYFETVTAMAFWLFAGNAGVPACDISVIEVGLGGRLDATNVISPCLSVITQIAFDHESFLGSTLEAIAGEKAGIIKPGIPTVVSPQSKPAQAVIERQAELRNAPLLRTAGLEVKHVRFSSRDCRFQFQGAEYLCALPGRHQLENALTAIVASRQLGVPVPAIQLGLAGVLWPGRLELLSEAPDLILDGAHNPAGAAALSNYIQEFLAGRPVWMVYGTMRDKAIDEVIATLFPLADRLILTAPDFPRALRPEIIADLANRPGAVITANVPEAIAAAKTAPPEAAVIFTGSLFLVGEVRARVLRKIGPG